MTDQDQKAAVEMIKAVYDDGMAEINGREYRFTTMTHKNRRKVFAFMNKVQGQLTKGDLSFIDDPAFDPVEKVINNNVTIDDSLLSKVGDKHWEEYPQDYLTFVQTALMVISYPFLGAGHTG